MLQTIKYQLRHLADFNGRDARQTFWYYVLFLVVLQFGIGIVLAAPMYLDIFFATLDGVAEGQNANALEARMMADMADSIGSVTMATAVLGFVLTALFIAAFVRRLHDAGFPGWLVLVPLVTQVAGTVGSLMFLDPLTEAMRRSVEDPEALVAAQSEAFAFTAIAYAGYLFVIVFGAWKSDGPNRWGDAPVRF